MLILGALCKTNLASYPKVVKRVVEGESLTCNPRKNRSAIIGDSI